MPVHRPSAQPVPVPRRRRPPLTTLEIGAYTSGGRLYRRWRAEELTGAHDVWALDVLAGDDALVMCALGARRFWSWFEAGWADAELLQWQL